MLKATENDNARDILGGKLERESIYIDVAIGTVIMVTTHVMMHQLCAVRYRMRREILVTPVANHDGEVPWHG